MGRLSNWFFKESHLFISNRSGSPLLDGGMSPELTVRMFTFDPCDKVSGVLSSSGDSLSLRGTSGINLFETFDPFPQSSLVWMTMYKMGLVLDVSAEIVHSKFGTLFVSVNNPPIGTPYVMLCQIPDRFPFGELETSRFPLVEGQTLLWKGTKGLVVYVSRMDDADCKDFLVRI